MGIAVWLLTIQKQNGDGRVTCWLGACQWERRYPVRIFRSSRRRVKILAVIINPARRIRGRLDMPGDKSISHRAAMIAALARGSSRIQNFSTSEDCAATLRCLQALGVSIEENGSDVLIQSRGSLSAPAAPLDCGNSGTTMRLLAGILAGQDFESILTGDESLRSRPMQRIIEPLTMMGAMISSVDGCAPLAVQGRKPLDSIEYELLVASAQVKSCILLAGLSANGETRVVEDQPTRDHTERLLRWFEVAVAGGSGAEEGERCAAVKGPATLQARDLDVPGDISSAAYFIAAAAMLEESLLEIENVGLNPTRTLFLEQMRTFGFSIDTDELREECHEPRGTVRASSTRAAAHASDPENTLTLHSALIPQLIDELPLLAVVGSQIDGGIEIREAAELRVKESDRISATVAGLRAMNAEVEEFEDGLRVPGPIQLRGAEIDSRGDHRIAMSFAIAGLLADGETEIKDAECVNVSFPQFFELLESVVER
ncbi:MAG TPA: 3-phosphoshikimate 1-carboxyvinyltransferase [Pyrinomonadaceae bacterium]|nr:3-phosphoshikimate 1-carboxyvinyltransferase [Pyrinomonadaceae bacterium]